MDLPTPEDPTKATVCPASNQGAREASDSALSVALSVNTVVSLATAIDCGACAVPAAIRMIKD